MLILPSYHEQTLMVPQDSFLPILIVPIEIILFFKFEFLLDSSLDFHLLFKLPHKPSQGGFLSKFNLNMFSLP